jgi:hypothetical protein
MFDPPADLPDDLKGVYERATAPVQIAVGFCSMSERFDYSVEQLSSWAEPLSQSWRRLAGWLRDHEAQLRSEVPEVVAACEGILGAVAPLERRLICLIGMLAPHAADPNDAFLVGMVNALRENNSRNPVGLAHAYLDGIAVSPDSLTELRSAVCAWASRRESARAASALRIVNASTSERAGVPDVDTPVQALGVERQQEEAFTAPQPIDTIPYTSPLSVPDLARMLRERGHSGATDDAVDAFLRRHRRNCPDSYEERDRDDRRRNEPKYLYRSDVWPLLVRHFAPATDDN